MDAGYYVKYCVNYAADIVGDLRNPVGTWEKPKLQQAAGMRALGAAAVIWGIYGVARQVGMVLVASPQASLIMLIAFGILVVLGHDLAMIGINERNFLTNTSIADRKKGAVGRAWNFLASGFRSAGAVVKAAKAEVVDGVPYQLDGTWIAQDLYHLLPKRG